MDAHTMPELIRRGVFGQLRLQPVSFGWGNGLFVWSEGGRELHRERVVADDIECRKII